VYLDVSLTGPLELPVDPFSKVSPASSL